MNPIRLIAAAATLLVVSCQSPWLPSPGQPTEFRLTLNATKVGAPSGRLLLPDAASVTVEVEALEGSYSDSVTKSFNGTATFVLSLPAGAKYKVTASAYDGADTPRLLYEGEATTSVIDAKTKGLALYLLPVNIAQTLQASAQPSTSAWGDALTVPAGTSLTCKIEFGDTGSAFTLTTPPDSLSRYYQGEDGTKLTPSIADGVDSITKDQLPSGTAFLVTYYQAAGGDEGYLPTLGVFSIPVQGLALPDAPVWKNVDKPATLACTPLPANATEALPGDLVWSTSDSAVAKIDGKTGTITPVAIGKTTIIVSSAARPTIKGSTVLTVGEGQGVGVSFVLSAPQWKYISFTPDTITMTEGTVLTVSSGDAALPATGWMWMVDFGSPDVQTTSTFEWDSAGAVVGQHFIDATVVIDDVLYSGRLKVVINKAPEATGEPMYRVRYSNLGADSGYAPVDDQEYPLAEGSMAPILPNTGKLSFARDGFTWRFLGWNTQSDGNGITYVPGQSVTFLGDVTLYPVWTAIGATGPAGGIVFYDKGNSTDGWRYLEAAPTDISALPWSPAGGVSVVTVDDVGPGAGYLNTLRIQDSTGYAAPYAARTCYNYSLGGFNDWYLPSATELWALNQLIPASVGGWQPAFYWSSVNAGTAEAWNYLMNGANNASNNSLQTQAFPVRAIRAFRSAQPLVAMRFDKNGATGGLVPADLAVYEAGDAIPGNVNGLTKSGYTFDGWNTAADGLGLNYPPGFVVPAGSPDRVLFAKWVL